MSDVEKAQPLGNEPFKAMSMSVSPASTKSKRKWVLEMCQFTEYRDTQGFCTWIPELVPFAAILSNITFGKVVSRLCGEEERGFCDLGFYGCMVCWAMIPCFLLGFWIPIIGQLIQGLFFCNTALVLRQAVIKKYNVEDDKHCGHWLLDYLYLGANFPCALYQMYESMRYWDEVDAVNGSIPQQKGDKSFFEDSV